MCTLAKGVRSTTGFYEQVELYKRDLISVALRECQGNVNMAARALELHPGTLHVYLNRYGIDPSAFYKEHNAIHSRLLSLLSLS